jgi:hypothetical protein
MTPDSQTVLTRLDALIAEASPLPWRQKQTGVIVDATGEPVSLCYIRNEVLGMVAVNHLRRQVAALAGRVCGYRDNHEPIRDCGTPRCVRCQALAALAADLDKMEE